MNTRMSTRLAPVIGFGLVALSVGVFVYGSNESQARAAGEKTVDKVVKLAAAIKAGDKDAVKTQAAALAKVDLDEVMDAFKPRTKGGVGVGKKGSITPDGIELKLQAMGRDAPGAGVLAKEVDALEDMAYIIAAVAEVNLAKGAPAGVKGKGKDWDTWSQEMKDASTALITAVKAKSSPDVKTVATKINNNCSACHAVFKSN